MIYVCPNKDAQVSKPCVPCDCGMDKLKAFGGDRDAVQRSDRLSPTPAEALEAAAKIADGFASAMSPVTGNEIAHAYEDGWDDAALKIAAAIRAYAASLPTPGPSTAEALALARALAAVEWSYPDIRNGALYLGDGCCPECERQEGVGHVKDCSLDAALSAHRASATGQADGWITWPGGDCPVPHDSVVDLKLRNGDIKRGVFADTWSWSRSGSEKPGEILAYRRTAGQGEGDNDMPLCTDEDCAMDRLPTHAPGRKDG